MQDRRGNQLIFSTLGTQEHRHHTRNVTGVCEERKSTTRLPSPLWVTWKSPGRPCFGRQCTGATSSESCGGVDSMRGMGWEERLIVIRRPVFHRQSVAVSSSGGQPSELSSSAGHGFCARGHRRPFQPTTTRPSSRDPGDRDLDTSVFHEAPQGLHHERRCLHDHLAVLNCCKSPFAALILCAGLRHLDRCCGCYAPKQFQGERCVMNKCFMAEYDRRENFLVHLTGCRAWAASAL